jgi:hypothetical protein
MPQLMPSGWLAGLNNHAVRTNKVIRGHPGFLAGGLTERCSGIGMSPVPLGVVTFNLPSSYRRSTIIIQSYGNTYTKRWRCRTERTKCRLSLH